MDNKTTGAFISARRKELQLNQKQLAEKLGVVLKSGAALVDLFRDPSSALVKLDYVPDGEIFVFIGAQKCAVDILAASALTDDCNVEFFHKILRVFFFVSPLYNILFTK